VRVSLLSAASAATLHHERIALLWLAATVPIAFAAILVAAALRDRVPDVPRELEEPPEDIHPVDLAFLWSAYRKHLSPRTAYRAGLLHLAATGAVEVTPIGSVSEPQDFVLRLRSKPRDPIDRDFVAFLFPRAHRDDAVSLASLRSRGGGRTRLRGWWADVSARGRTSLERMWRGENRIELYAAFGLGVLVVPAMVGTLAPDSYGGSGGWAGWIFLEGAAGWLLTAAFLPAHLRPQLHERLVRWRAFRRYLLRFSSVRDAPAAAIVIWGRYLEYAVALGIARHVERQVNALSPWSRLPSPWPGAPHGLAGYRWATAFRRRAPRRAPPPALSSDRQP